MDPSTKEKKYSTIIVLDFLVYKTDQIIAQCLNTYIVTE